MRIYTTGTVPLSYTNIFPYTLKNMHANICTTLIASDIPTVHKVSGKSLLKHIYACGHTHAHTTDYNTQ